MLILEYLITSQVVKRLNMMLGPGYYEAFEPMACNYIPGMLLENLINFSASMNAIPQPAGQLRLHC